MLPLHPMQPRGSPRAMPCGRRGKGMGDALEDCCAAAFLPQQRGWAVFPLYTFSEALSFK